MIDFLAGVLGGCVVAQVHQALSDHLVTDPDARKVKQPDVMNLHFEFLRPAEHAESIITITNTKLGVTSSTFQVTWEQKDKLRVIALARSTNFDVSLGPTVATGWKPHMPPTPSPQWDLIRAGKPDPHWMAMRNKGELMPLNRNFSTLYPKEGFASPSYTYSFRSLADGSPIDAAYVDIMIDLIPDMGDTIMNNDTMYDAMALWKRVKAHDQKNPGSHYVSKWTVQEASKSPYLPATGILDIEYKRRLPSKGLPGLLITSSAKMIEKGRLDTEVTASTQDHELICVSRQIRLLIDASRRYGEQPKPSL